MKRFDEMMNDDLHPCIQETKTGVILHVRAAPKAAQSKFMGLHGDAVKIAVKAPPVDGAANEELIRFLAKSLGIAKSRIEVVRGESSRTKQILLQNAQTNDIEKKIREFLK